MKSRVSPVLVAVMVTLAVVIIGGIGYKMFGPKHLPGIENEEMRKKYFPNGYPYTRNLVKQPDAGANTGH